MVKTFIWQACSNILPIKENLHRRHVTDYPIYPLCESSVETIGHVLWSCPAARDVWYECNIKIQKCSSVEVMFTNILEMLFKRLGAEEIDLVVGVARHIWLRINKYVFGEGFEAPSVLLQRAKDQEEASCKANQSGREQFQVPNTTCRARWKKPREGTVKIN